MNDYDQLRDWADIRLFLAIVDHKSLVAAAEHLELTQPTLGRRLSAMQKRFGATLFIRDGRQLALTDAGHAIVDSARRMQREMQSIQRSIDVSASGLSGIVTISATEGTGTEWLPPVMHAFHRQYPDITLNLLIENRAVDIVMREADIALRLVEPTQPELIAKRLVSVGFGWYASARYLKHNAPIVDERDLLQHNLLGFTAAGQRVGVTPFQEHPLDSMAKFSLLSNSAAAHLSAVRAGYGIGVISHRWATMYEDLIAVLPGHSVASTDLWIVTHTELRHSARIRATYDFILEEVRSAQRTFEHGLSAD